MNAPPQLDWYECTLTSIFDESTVLQGLGGVGVAEPGPARQNYPASLHWELPSGGSVEIWYGGGLEVHVVLTSGACDDLVEVVRRRWPHRVSRADVAKDYDYEGSFEDLYRPLVELGLAQRPNPVKVGTAGDWVNLTPGRTLYLGSRGSRMYLRVYEKGHEQTAKHPDQTFSLNWTRVEAEVRPRTSAHKIAMSTMSPAEIFAYTRFGAEVLGHLDGTEHTALPLQRVPSTDPLYWLVQQYGAQLRRLVTEDPNMTIVALLARATERVPA